MAGPTTGAGRSPEPAPLLRLQLLGGFRAVRDSGVPPAQRWSRPSAQTLVKLLAVAPDHQLHREHAIAICWPEADPQAGIGSLRVALHAARRALEPELAPRAPSSYLISEGALLRLEPSTVSVDVDHAEQQALTALQAGDADALVQALAAFTGELLPEDRYAPWTETVRHRLDLLRERLRLALADALLEERRADEAITVADEILAENPTEEHAHRTLIAAYLQQGLRRRAIRQYHACRDVLDAELGLRPDADTERLHMQALETSGVELAGPAEGVFPPPALRNRSGLPLRGRGEPLRQLLGGAAVVHRIGGEAGLGKTRLVTAAASARLDAGAAVLWGAGHAAEGQTPYGVFVEALDGWLAERPPAERARVGAEYPELAGLLPSLGSTGSDAARSPEDERQRLFRATAGLLEELAASVPVYVVLDDMHDGDLGSVQLLGYLARRAVTAGLPWQFVVCYRDDELAPSDPRRRTLDTLVRDGLAQSVELGRLGRSDCEAVAADLLGTDSPVPDRVWELSLGNPLFALELAREAVLVPMSEPARPPRGVRQLMEVRLARLDPVARRVAEVVAVAGGDAALGEVLDVAAEGLHPPLSAAEATSGADGAVAGSVLRDQEVVLDGRPVPGLVFDHPLIRLTCYEQLSTARRRLLHAAYADTVLRRRPDSVDTLAAHLVLADDPRATRYLRQAAERAAALCANDVADHYYVELTGRLDAVAAEAAWARIDRSAVLLRMGRTAEACDVLAEALDALRRRGDVDGRVLATGRLAEALARNGEPERARALLDADPPTEDTSAVSAAVSHSSRTLVNLMVGEYQQAVVSAEKAREFAERVAGPNRRGLLARALQYQASSLALAGRFVEAGPVAEEALPHAEAFGDPRILASVLSVQREQLRRAGRLRDALGIGRRALELAQRSGDPAGVAFEQANLAELHLLLGEQDEASRLAEAAVVASRTRPDLSTPYALIALAKVRMMAGTDPEPLLAEALDLATRHTDRQAESEAVAALAHWHVASGRPDRALVLLSDTAIPGTANTAARAHLVAGRPEIAAELAREELARASAAGERLTEAEAREIRAAALAAQDLRPTS